MHLFRVGFGFFALFVNVHCLHRINDENTDCLFEESNESAPDNNNDFPVLSLLLRVFYPPRQETSAQNCTNYRLRQIELGMHDLKQRILALEADSLLRSSLAEARKAFDSVYYVYDSMKVFWKFNGSSEAAEVISQCNQYNPKNALLTMARIASHSSKLFQSIVSGSRYSEDIFNETVSVIITEAAICAILAEECDKFLHPNSFDGPAQKLRRNHISGSLTTIATEISLARHLLNKRFSSVVVDVIKDALDYIDSTGIGRREGVKHVYQALSTQFSSRAWAVTISKSIHQQATSVHMREGTTDNWYIVDNEHHTIVAHYADKRGNCTFNGANLRRMKLSDIIGDRDRYTNFVKQTGDNLGEGISLLKTALRRIGLTAPDNYFISIAKYHQSFSIEHDNEFHFFELVHDEITGEFMKTVLIGWC